MAAFFTRRNQLQWLALLVIAVVLPTVSLLWFMSRVIANERLVVRQKLTVLYQDKLAEATARTESMLANRIADLDTVKSGTNPYSYFRRLILDYGFQGVVVRNADGSVAYPRTTIAMGSDARIDNPLADAWQLEFAKQSFADAALAYDRLAHDDNPRIAIAALTGKSRCLLRLGNLDDAITECRRAAFMIPTTGEPATRLAVENARLLLLSLLRQSSQTQLHADLFRQTISALIADVYNPDGKAPLLEANQNLFIARKTLERLEPPFHAENAKEKTQLEKLVLAESLSIAAAEGLQPFTAENDGLSEMVDRKNLRIVLGKSFSMSVAGSRRSVAQDNDGLFQTTLDQKQLYVLRCRTGSQLVLALLSDAGVDFLLSGYRDAFAGSEAAYRIVNGAGDFIAGTPEAHGEPFTAAALPAGFHGWKVQLYFQGGDVFQKAANRQIAVYVWTGILVIALILIAAAFAMRAIGRQIRLNEMKNDFIATVSHELKTPLASMRVLVDTLLEGRVRDEAQAKDYLRMTAKENERLSRMIDNFLTFSRMERNKKAFTITDATPAAIVRDSVESVQTKFAARNCHLSIEVAGGLPEIQADHDAVVTVLVNLLDNACKYTNDDKHVTVKVFADNDSVCFAVSDNGIGLARKHLRRIFDRFYQVDSSLARKAEGCGLGLSIVKFIVDAHKGTVSVESKPGQGSTFTVRLPVSQNNRD